MSVHLSVLPFVYPRAAAFKIVEART